MGTVLKQLANNNEEFSELFWIKNATGLVFDSAPAYQTPDMAARCVQRALLLRQICNFGCLALI